MKATDRVIVGIAAIAAIANVAAAVAAAVNAKASNETARIVKAQRAPGAALSKVMRLALLFLTGPMRYLPTATVGRRPFGTAVGLIGQLLEGPGRHE